jgi:extracellular elastinolytic metalloproteinase
MIGGMSGKLAGAIGEGASDVNAFLLDGDDRIGEYAWGDRPASAATRTRATR